MANLSGTAHPPSRNGFSGKFVDLTDVHAEAKARNQSDIEQEELQRAVAESMKDMPGQENGVTGTGHQFGPANRAYYDPSQWTVVPLASSREVFEHPLPSKRRRLPDHPTFLRGSTDTGYLAPLLTIYHSIPLAREALLFPFMRAFSYGHDPAWWSGSTDENNKSLSVESSDANSRDRRNLLCEIQCLMAFLDGTSRAYGSVDALANLRAYQNFQAESDFSKLLETWKCAAMAERSDSQLTQIFTSVALKSAESPGPAPVEKELMCLEPPLASREGYKTLEEVLDNVVWNDTILPLDDVWIDHAAEIFTIRLFDSEKGGKGLGLAVSEIWYPDRYLEEYRNLSMEMRQHRRALRLEVNRLSVIQRRITEMPLPNGSRRNIRQILDAAVKFAPLAADNVFPEEADASNPGHKVDPSRMQTQISSLLERIDTKVKELEEKKAKLFGQIRQIMLYLMTPSDDPSRPPHHKYLLQGVSTKPNITYLRRRNHDLLGLNEEEQEEGGEGEDGSARDWQWWRIAWNEDGETPPPIIGPPTQAQSQGYHNGNLAAPQQNPQETGAYSIRKVMPAEVIEAAKIEHDSVVLVYAKESAMNFTSSPVSVALKQFVEQDNRAFEEELREEQEGGTRRWSNDTTTTIMDYDPTNGQIFADREMTPMSTVSTIRDANGQPSPKRPRSSDDSTPERDMEDDKPPPFEASADAQEMQEKRGNKIGFFANQLLEKYGGEIDPSRTVEQSDEGAMHTEHPKSPLP